MSKKFIQQLVREDLMSRLREAGKNTEKKNKPEPAGKKDEENEYPEDTTKTDKPSQEKDYHELNAGEKKKVKTMTNKIKNATQGSDRILKLSQVMSASGALCGDQKCQADNASHRSMIGKAVSGKPDADGKKRNLDLQQATAMSKVIDNPPAYN
jgi:hypothetical protein